EAYAGVRTGAPLAVDSQPHANARLGGDAGDAGGAPRARLASRPQGREQNVVLGGQADGHADRVRKAADDEALVLEPVRELLSSGRPDEDEVRERGRALVAGRLERRAHPLPLGDGLLDVEAGLAERGR